MSLINLLKTSISSIKSHKLRVFLTSIGIIIGISSVVTILSIGNGLKAEVLSSFEEAESNKYTLYYDSGNTGMMITEEYFHESDIEDLSKIEGVSKVEIPQGIGAGFTFSAAAITYFDKETYGFIDSFNNKQLDVIEGRGYEAKEEDNKVIILSYTEAEYLFDNVENAIGKGVTIANEIYEVIGVMPEVTGFSIMPASSYISKNFMTSIQDNSYITQLDVYLESNVDKEKILDEMNALLKNIHSDLEGEYKFEDSQAITKAYEQIIGSVTGFITLVTGISLFVGGIGVMNIMYVSVSERKREIGIRRAIGAKPISILLQFLFEAIIVTGMGGLIGILCGYLFSKLVSNFLPFPAIMSVGSFIGATLTSVIVGIIFGIIPAYKASKLDPIKAIYN